MDNYDITVTCASGVEAAAKREIKRICKKEPPAVNGAMTFSGDSFTVAALNVSLRTADRVYINVGSFTATSFDELYEGVRNVEWERFIGKNGKILVNGKSRKSVLYALSASQSVIKKAIADRLCKKYGVNRLSETGERYAVEFWILEDKVTLLINTSGEGLHKRGYRDLVWNAPIRETLAAAMLTYSNFPYEAPLADPFCGSGTILIEGAMMALGIAPGKRRKFDFIDWKKFDKNAYGVAIEQALSLETPRKITVLGSDIQAKAVTLAKHHAKNAGLADKITFKRLPVADFFCETAGGTIVTNAPYGERSLDKESAAEAYKDLRRAYDKLSGWSLHLITSFASFERTFGRSADKNRKLYNADKECKLYSYFPHK